MTKEKFIFGVILNAYSQLKYKTTSFQTLKLVETLLYLRILMDTSCNLQMGSNLFMFKDLKRIRLRVWQWEEISPLLLEDPQVIQLAIFNRVPKPIALPSKTTTQPRTRIYILSLSLNRGVNTLSNNIK